MTLVQTLILLIIEPSPYIIVIKFFINLLVATILVDIILLSREVIRRPI